MKYSQILFPATVFALLAGISLTLESLLNPEPHGTSDISYSTVLATSLPDLGGQQQPLGKWQGKLLVLNFWATWCAPCREEIPEFNRIYEKYSDKSIEIVGIAVDSQSKVEQFAKNYNIRYVVLVDETRGLELSKRLGNRMGLLPHTVIFDQDGKTLLNKLGKIEEKELLVAIETEFNKNKRKIR